jgi:signal transduction histidine kinase
MRTIRTSIFTSIGLLMFLIIMLFGAMFIYLTYLSANHYYQATTQLLNKDVAAHIAKFTSPFKAGGLDKKKADSVFHDAMVLSPSIEVYFLDTLGVVQYFQAPDSMIRLRKIPLDNIHKLIASGGRSFIKGPDPKNPSDDEVFSAAEVSTEKGKLGYIYVILGSNEYRKVSRSLFDNHVLMLTLQVFGVIVALSLLLSAIYLKRIRKNFTRITHVMDQYRSGNHSARLQTDRYNEFSSLADGFNAMADQLDETIDRLLSTEKERKDFLANISHDLRTPLSIARGYIETLKEEIRKEPGDAAKQELFVQMAAKKIYQLESMVAQLFDLSRMESPEFKPVLEPLLISDIIEETVSTAQPASRVKHITLSCIGCQHPYWVLADTGMMERLVQNLIDNAVKYTPEHGRVQVTVSSVQDALEIVVENSDKPLNAALVEWINNVSAVGPMSGKPHSGLGLAIVLKILQLHHFSFSASTHEGINYFKVIMPIYKSGQ